MLVIKKKMRRVRFNPLHIFYLTVGSVIFLAVSSRFNIKYIRYVEDSSSEPDWLRTDQEKCSPETKIAFLKTHKCASSAIQNILFRYGEKYDLLFALPNGNYFGDGTRYIQKAFIDAQVENKMGFDILAMHGKWNMTYMRSVLLPESTIFVTIVRDPVDLFISLFDYTNMAVTKKTTLENYIKTVGINEGREHGGFVGMNQMTWDFGLPPRQFDNQTKIDKIIEEADKTFHLVMVSERMPESLVLLKHLLCADYEDFVTLKVNARKKDVASAVPKLDSKTRSILRKKLSPDYKLYEHFTRKFDKLVHSFGIDKMNEEISKLDHAQLDIQEECNFHQRNSTNKKVGRFVSNSKDGRCRAMATEELMYIKLLKMKQKRKIAMRQIADSDE